MSSDIYIKSDNIYSRTSVKHITYLDELKPLTTRKMRKTTIPHSYLHLDLSQDAYVLNQYAFNLLDKDNTYDYLKSGGLLIVNDKKVTNNDIKRKIDLDIERQECINDENYYGFYIFNDGEKNIPVNVSLGYLNSSKEISIDKKNIIEEIDKETIIEDIVSIAMPNSSIAPTANVPLPDVGGRRCY